jgi:large subunit ribosomal protein L6
MSRVGKHPVSLPQGVSAEIKGNTVVVKGKLGTLSLDYPAEVKVELADGKISVQPVSQSARARMMWGTIRNRVANMVKGVSEGFKKVLDIEGVGFRAAMQGKDLVLQLGFSHEVRYQAPTGIEIKAEKPTQLLISGFDKQMVGQVAAEIRGMKKPEPYKGKGIRYAGEQIRRKEGKKK